MNNFEYSQKYFEAMKKLHGTGGKRSNCQHPGCHTITLADCCQKHTQVRRLAVAGDEN